MPELPEVQAVVEFFRKSIVGKTIKKITLLSVSALKTFDPPINSLPDKSVVGVQRRGKYLCVELEGFFLAIGLAKAGWIHWHDQVPSTTLKIGKTPVVMRISFEDGSGFDVTEQGTQKRASIFVVKDLDDIDFISSLGPDPLDEGFGLSEFTNLLKNHPGTIKSVLSDQKVIAGIGNAYSDEILHRARLSPYKRTTALSDAEVKELFLALRSELNEAITAFNGLVVKELKPQKHSSMKVHGRSGQNCPVCGDVIKQVSFANRSFQYCPTCQTEGKVLADRRMSRLLK